ncbi:hypothetical protein [Streptomyces sp. Ru62]|uniref:hypothetical protein n=1 Tax=Streptomyces sp. Ru62 TaxID=2080745 RepID=UPI0027E43D9B|nr:hypothetical protein [Streptomyces sp. Ru62]
MSGWWPLLEERTRREVDAEVLRDRRLPAVRSVWNALRPLGLGLAEAERVVHARYEALADQVRRTPPDPLDVPSLAARAAALPGRVAAIEAVWDGDTVHDWFVVLIAVLEDPDGDGHLATVHHRRDGSPPRTAAAEAGRALADHLGVPFRFPSPHVPDDQTPRRRAVARPTEEPWPSRWGDRASRNAALLTWSGSCGGDCGNGS